MRLLNNLKTIFNTKSKLTTHNKTTDYYSVNFRNLNINYTPQQVYENPVVFRCVNLIAQNIANVECYIKDAQNEIVYDHPKAKLFRQPSKYNDWSKFIYEVVSDLVIYGNSYLYRLENNTGDQIIRLNPSNCRIVQDFSGRPEKYIFGNTELLPDSPNFLHIKNFNPYAPSKGISILSIVEKSAILYDTITKHNQSILDKGGRVSGALIVNSELTDEQRADLKNALKNGYTGSNNAGEVMVFEGDMKWQEMSISSKDMDFNEGKILAAKEIAMAFGVPFVILGMQSSYNNQHKEERLHWWEDSLIPMLNIILSDLNSWLLEGTELKLTHNFKKES
ncbi:MAG: phage portal protein [Alphaproteobacteria bacterium]|nr:MAG: phage portal protein [Alphaproteobacteria bacterium]